MSAVGPYAPPRHPGRTCAGEQRPAKLASDMVDVGRLTGQIGDQRRAGNGVVNEFLVSLLTAGASLLSTRGWPTLSKRVRDHTSLLKDMPADVAGPLKELLADEVRTLAARERQWLDTRKNRLLNLRRVALVGMGTFTLAGLVVALVTPGSRLEAGAGVKILVLVSVVILLGTLVTLGANRALRRGGHPGRKAGDEP
jgi:hypothetical protein